MTAPAKSRSSHGRAIRHSASASVLRTWAEKAQ